MKSTETAMAIKQEFGSNTIETGGVTKQVVLMKQWHEFANTLENTMKTDYNYSDEELNKKLVELHTAKALPDNWYEIQTSEGPHSQEMWKKVQAELKVDSPQKSEHLFNLSWLLVAKETERRMKVGLVKDLFRNQDPEQLKEAINALMIHLPKEDSNKPSEDRLLEPATPVSQMEMRIATFTNETCYRGTARIMGLSYNENAGYLSADIYRSDDFLGKKMESVKNLQVQKAIIRVKDRDISDSMLSISTIEIHEDEAPVKKTAEGDAVEAQDKYNRVPVVDIVFGTTFFNLTEVKLP